MLDLLAFNSSFFIQELCASVYYINFEDYCLDRSTHVYSYPWRGSVRTYLLLETQSTHGVLLVCFDGDAREGDLTIGSTVADVQAFTSSCSI